MKKVLNYIKKHQKDFEAKWFEALRIPSVSAQQEHQPHIQTMANWLVELLSKDLNMKTSLLLTKGNPLVYAESPEVPGAPVVLVYGHYDVQPSDPDRLWKNKGGPFEPEIREGNVYCRGADDDKGQSLTHVFAAKAWLEAHGSLPVQLKFIFDGEEEVGSSSLSEFLQTPEAKKLLAADVILVSDSAMPGPNQPAICYGLRGVQAFELVLTGPKRDLHSGHYGGSVANPAIILSKVLASIADDNGIIQVPDFYKGLIETPEVERKLLAESPFDEQQSLQEIGLDASWGDSAFTPLERRSIRPSFDINGLTSGYQGKGGKTIIPSVASAKFTFRLVPDQSPQAIAKNLRAFIKKQIPQGIKMKLATTEGTCGMVVPIDSPYMTIAAKVLQKTFGNKTFFIREGGSIPIVAELRNLLQADLLLIGYGLADDAIHSPNEKFSLDGFHLGIENNVRLLQAFAGGTE